MSSAVDKILADFNRKIVQLRKIAKQKDGDAEFYAEAAEAALEQERASEAEGARARAIAEKLQALIT